MVLIDSGSTHIFIHCKLAKALNSFLYPAPKFQVMTANEGTINCSGKYHNITLTMGEYVLNIPMISITMGGIDVVLGVQWLQSLGMMSFNFLELFMKFKLDGKDFELRCITGKPSKVIISHSMTKLLKKGHQGVITQLCSLAMQISKYSISLDLQKVMDKHSKVFEDVPRGLPPHRDHDHAIHLILESVPPNIRPYRYPIPKRVKLSAWLKKCWRLA